MNENYNQFYDMENTENVKNVLYHYCILLFIIMSIEPSSIKISIYVLHQSRNVDWIKLM